MTYLRGAFNLAIRRFAGPFWSRRRWLDKTQWMSGAELNSLQSDLFVKLVKHSYESVPYYRQLMDRHGICVEKITSLDDIKRFPIVTKQDVLKSPNSFVSRKVHGFLCRTAYTGGTTGTPMKLTRDLFSIGNEHAFVRRQWDWAGIGLNDRCAYLTGRIIVNPNQIAGKLYRYDPFMKELILSTYHLSPATAKSYVDAIGEYKVKAIVGYPSAIFLLANTCLENNLNLKVGSVLTSSETLTESMRNTIAEAFECKVFDFYGSAERVCYIFTCEKGSYHLQPEYGLTECVPVDESNPKRCKIVSTGFWNRAMPLIRYDLGDIVNVSPAPCECGRQFPVVESIEGRMADTIKTPSGRQFGAAILTHLLYGTDHIIESQIEQDSLDHLTIKYVPSDSFSSKDFDSFDELIKKHLPGELKYDFKEVDRIPRTSSGKLKPIVSLIT